MLQGNSRFTEAAGAAPRRWGWGQSHDSDPGLSDSNLKLFPPLCAIPSEPIIKQNNTPFTNEKLSCVKVTRRLLVDGLPNMRQILFLETAFGIRG